MRIRLRRAPGSEPVTEERAGPALGVCYYPEHWPESEWARDARRMAEVGLQWVRIGEFAWSRLEPSPGDLNFGWLDRAIDVLGSVGLRVVLGTPTATPPRWMLERHPDMLGVDREGRPRKFGSRRHYCFSHPGYGEECDRIVRLLAARYGANPHVRAWQTDNEYGCHDTTLSWSEHARRGFRDWLADRYGQIDCLNRAWGNAFWSMEYRSYREIDLPNLTVTEPNPAHVLDFRRYSSERVVAFNRRQAEIVRAHTQAPVSHNFMGRHTSFDHFELARDLDIAAWDSYPLGFLDERTDVDDRWIRRFARQGDPDFQAFHHDLYRAAGRGRMWVMEQQPGPVNWASHNPAPLDGMVRLWSWEAVAHGAETVCYFRWRQAPFGQEQMHAGLLRPDGHAAPALEEVARTARELRDRPPLGPGPRHAALIFDYESAWAWEAQPHGAGFGYLSLLLSFYRALRRNALNVDVLPATSEDLSGYGLIVVPGLFAWPAGLKERLATSGSVVLLGPRTGSRTAEFRIPDALPPDWDAPGVTVERVESLRPDLRVPLSAGGAVHTWVERCSGEAEVVERTRSGLPILFRRGRIRYLAGWPDAEAMHRILREAATEAGLPAFDLPDCLRTRVTDRGRFWANYGGEPVPPGSVRGLERGLSPADIAWTRT